MISNCLEILMSPNNPPSNHLGGPAVRSSPYQMPLSLLDGLWNATDPSPCLLYIEALTPGFSELYMYIVHLDLYHLLWCLT